MIALRQNDSILTDGIGLTFSVFGRYSNTERRSMLVSREISGDVLFSVRVQRGLEVVEIDSFIVANSTSVDKSFSLWLNTKADNTLMFHNVDVKAGETVILTYDTVISKSTFVIPLKVGDILTSDGIGLTYTIFGKYNHVGYRQLVRQRLSEAYDYGLSFLIAEPLVGRAIETLDIDTIMVCNPTGADKDIKVWLNGVLLATDTIKAGSSKNLNWTIVENTVVSGGINSVQGGTNIGIDNTDPLNPIVNFQLGADENFVTNAEKVVIGNTSGVNTGDQDVEMDNTVFDGDGTILTPFTLKNFGDGKERVNKDGAWAEATGGGGGHVIIDESGNPMPQRENLQFTGAVEVTDDIVNDKTVVEVTGGSGGNKNLYSIYMLNNLGRTI